MHFISRGEGGIVEHFKLMGREQAKHIPLLKFPKVSFAQFGAILLHS